MDDHAFPQPVTSNSMYQLICWHTSMFWQSIIRTGSLLTQEHATCWTCLSLIGIREVMDQMLNTGHMLRAGLPDDSSCFDKVRQSPTSDTGVVEDDALHFTCLYGRKGYYEVVRKSRCWMTTSSTEPWMTALKPLKTTFLAAFTGPSYLETAHVPKMLLEAICSIHITLKLSSFIINFISCAYSAFQRTPGKGNGGIWDEGWQSGLAIGSL